MKFTLGAIALGAAAVAAQNANESLCDKYTTAALKNNTSENQLTLLTLLVNTVVIGSYSDAANKSVQVPGILANGTVEGQKVSLLKYFDGSLLSTNRDDKAVSVNFLDGGAAEPLKQNKPANDENSNQYTLLTHLYQVFGVALGCSMQGDGKAFPAYGGSPSMSKVHKYMNLNTAETTYFVQQVGAAAQSFGVSSDDINTVATYLTNTFNKRCAPPTPLATGAPAVSQSICVAADCALAEKSDCGIVSDVNAGNGTNNVDPQRVSAATSSTMGGASSTTAAGGSMSGTSRPSTTGAPANGAMAMVINSVAAIALAGGAVAAAALL